jgi:hypothetical protein
MRWLWIAVSLGLGLMVSAGAAGTGAAQNGDQTAPGSGSAVETDSEVLERAVRLGENEIVAPPRYTYRSAGRRDPFVSLLEQEEDDVDDGLPAIGEIYIVGILWGAQDRFALAETRHGVGLVLREGDALRDGRVVSVQPDGVTVRQHYYGMTRRVRLPIVSGEEVGDER